MSKLVRDKIPSLIEEANKTPITHAEVDQTAILLLLKEKLLEEANEVVDAESSGKMIMELVDVYEVIRALAGYYNVPMKFIQTLAVDKRKARGSFSKMIVLDEVKEND